MTSRRDFIRNTSILGTASLTMGTLGQAIAFPAFSGAKGKMKLKFRPYTLQLNHVFTLATSSRSTTPVVLTEIEYEGLVGYGEASMPPYLGESHETVLKFLGKVDLSKFDDPFQLEDILHYVDQLAPENKAAKASVDIALHDLIGKIMQQPWYKIWGYNPVNTPVTSFTIGIDTAEVVRQKVKEAEPYKLLKVKLGRDTDKMMIETIREVTDKPICVDINQGWTDRNFALDMAGWLKEKGVVFIEQGMPKERIDDNAWLTENSPLPTFGDESVQRLPDVLKAYKVYSGINIKLMKSTGMREAHKMLTMARSLGMKVMIGCMTETSCAISAAAQLAPMADYADLDGALLIGNDVFKGMTIQDGKVTLSTLPGIGVKLI
ncbi:muconate cycloisomerase [Pedobacter antarcticus 4BY]|uniref:Dipeptide epimerase n=2 Tax=Pedobacter antarcticus TaxID=34086 RepID=A0A081PCZ6_9SPHI|nr:dipeptide epimerase [Pedobacter antarcticus]KEQ28569.1 muconate cycloisomerase [Pedobacter antarcticus 4BY]SFE35849.1 L-alanine-DL-glutamate epimerase [Pedobacter antarcticus]